MKELFWGEFAHTYPQNFFHPFVTIFKNSFIRLSRVCHTVCHAFVTPFFTRFVTPCYHQVCHTVCPLVCHLVCHQFVTLFFSSLSHHLFVTLFVTLFFTLFPFVFHPFVTRLSPPHPTRGRSPQRGTPTNHPTAHPFTSTSPHSPTPAPRAPANAHPPRKFRRSNIPPKRSSLHDHDAELLYFYFRVGASEHNATKPPAK